MRPFFRKGNLNSGERTLFSDQRIRPDFRNSGLQYRIIRVRTRRTNFNFGLAELWIRGLSDQRAATLSSPNTPQYSVIVDYMLGQKSIPKLLLNLLSTLALVVIRQSVKVKNVKLNSNPNSAFACIELSSIFLFQTKRSIARRRGTL